MKRSLKIISILIGFGLVSFALAVIVPALQTGLPGKPKVAKINIEGVIRSSGSNGLFSSGINSEKVLNKLEKAQEDKEVGAILLRINSPGGGAVASKEIAEKVKLIEKPVLARIVSQGTSGAYWIASAADKIMADPLSLVGSIGVTSSYLEFSGLFEKYGIEYVRLTSGKYKDIGSQYRNLTEREREILMSKIMKVDEVFKEEVKDNRGLNESQIKEINSSKFYLGIEAKGIDLVDVTGARDETEEMLKETLNVSEIKYKEYEESYSLFDLLFSTFKMDGFKAISRIPKFY